ncbi:MAG: DUF3187 family protein [Pseudomonadales bacterium]
MQSTRSVFYLAAILVFAQVYSIRLAADDSPFATANRTVFVRSLGLPNIEDARELAARQSTAAFTIEQTSQFAIDDQGLEQAFLDGESSTATLKLRHAFTKRFVIGMDIPFVSHDGGFMDSFVEGWHRTFGLPNARREEFSRDQLLFTVNTPEASARLDSSGSGVGDVALLAQYQLLASQHANLSAQLRLEAPTGNAEKLIGSESWDVALGLNAYRGQLAGDWRMSFHGSLGVVLPGNSDLLPQLQNDSVVYGSAALALPVFYEWLTLKAQLEAHSAFYDTDIKSLGSTSVQLTFGVGMQLDKRWNLNIGLSEDIAVRTAPDFTVVMSLEYR